MSIYDLVVYLLMGLSMSIAYITIGFDLAEEKFEFKTFKNYVIIFLLSILLLINYFFVVGILRIIFIIIAIYIIFKFCFKQKFDKIIFISFLVEAILMIAELIFLLILTIIKTSNVSILLDSYTGTLITNVAIATIGILISRLPFWKKILLKLQYISKGFKKHTTITILLVLLISINFIFLSMYYKYNLSFIIVVNSLISCLYLLICFRFMTTENKYNKINNKYNNTLNSLREYEEILDVYRVSSHENKNQLLTIRSMIVKKEKNIPEYIDKIIDNNIKDDEKLMFDTNAIPAGGLRAVIYSKLLVMKDKKIKFNLTVDRKVRTVELIELGEDLMLDVCKVIGVFLDNAIESVLELKKKNISINLFADEEILNIEISNNYKGDIDLTKIDDKGYTSKSDGHGYGLSLVKEIINKNKKLENERKINKNIFTQKLKIKLK